MTYEIIMIDPVAAAGVSVSEGLEPYDLTTKYMLRWHRYEVQDHDMVYDQRQDPIGATLTVGSATAKVVFGIQPRENGFVVKRLSELHPTDQVLQKYGPYDDDVGYFLDDSFVSWIRDKVFNTTLNEKEVNGQCWLMRLRAIQPIRSERFHGKISLYQTRENFDLERQVAMKAGRAFKFIFPEFSDSDVETLVDAFRERFSLRKYTLKTGKKPDEFTHAYQHDQAEMDNPENTYDRKAMIHSCMRYRFDHLPVHPCSIYGSGDFEIVWLENDKGCIGGRCVVYTGGAKPAAGPIYGVCEKSLDMITEYLEGIGATINQDGTWLGAKLIKHEHDNGYVGPYLDLDPKRLDEDGDYLVVCGGGDIDASQYQGILGGGYTTCSGCGDSVSEDEYYHSEYDENNYCECCYSNNHTYCEYEGETVHNSEMSEVWVSSRFGYSTEMVSDIAIANNFIECTDGKHWHEDDVSYCECEEVYISPKTFSDDYFRSDWDGEIYPNGLKCTLEDSLEVADSEIVEDDNTWEKNDQGVWIIVEEEDE